VEAERELRRVEGLADLVRVRVRVRVRAR